MVQATERAELAAGSYLQPFDLDALAEPTGIPIKIKGQTFYMAADDDLSIDDRENLRLFSLRLREMEAWDVDPDTGMMSPENEALMQQTRLKMCRIAMPNLPDEILTSLLPIQQTKMLDLFLGAVSNLRWIDKTVLNWLQNRQRPRREFGSSANSTYGASTTTPIEPSSEPSGSDTSASSPDSEASTAAAIPNGDPSTD